MKKIFSKLLNHMPIILVVFFLDQITKFLVLKSFSFNQIKPITANINLTLVFNHGAAFGMLSSQSGWQKYFFIIIAVVMITVFTLWLIKLKPDEKLEKLSLAFILGGALGNLSDRIFLGYVIDFIDFHINSWHWPSFNLADSAICIGAFFYLLSLAISSRSLKKCR